MLDQDIDTWYYHETLANNRGYIYTKNNDFWYACLIFEVEDTHPASSYRYETKPFRCVVPKVENNSQNEHTSKYWEWKQITRMTKTMTERWSFSWFLSLYRHIPTESAKMASSLVRNYSFSLLHLLFLLLLLLLLLMLPVLLLPLLLLLLLLFNHLLPFMSMSTKPLRTIGDTQKTMTISWTTFLEV